MYLIESIEDFLYDLYYLFDLTRFLQEELFTIKRIKKKKLSVIVKVLLRKIYNKFGFTQTIRYCENLKADKDIINLCVAFVNDYHIQKIKKENDK